MSVVCVLCNIFLLFPLCVFGLSVGRSQPVGCVPHHVVCSITSGFRARMTQMSEDELLERSNPILSSAHRSA